MLTCNLTWPSSTRCYVIYQPLKLGMHSSTLLWNLRSVPFSGAKQVLKAQVGYMRPKWNGLHFGYNSSLRMHLWPCGEFTTLRWQRKRFDPDLHMSLNDTQQQRPPTNEKLWYNSSFLGQLRRTVVKTDHSRRKIWESLIYHHSQG